MNKVYTTAVAIIPPEDIWDPIQEIRKKYDRQIDRWMPHINLIYPFRLVELFENLERDFFYVCQQFEPFEISLNKINYFSHKRQNYTMWIAPEPIQSLKKLQTELIKIVPDCNDLNNFKNGFTPHLSIGQIKGKANLFNTIKNLQKDWKGLKILLNMIYFISREKKKNSKFSVIKEIPLKI